VEDPYYLGRISGGTSGVTGKDLTKDRNGSGRLGREVPSSGNGGASTRPSQTPVDGGVGEAGRDGNGNGLRGELVEEVHVVRSFVGTAISDIIDHGRDLGDTIGERLGASSHLVGIGPRNNAGSRFIGTFDLDERALSSLFDR
jgi:hypothetical protein